MAPMVGGAGSGMKDPRERQGGVDADPLPEAATVPRNNLAYAYQSAGRLEEAIPLYERTLTDRERVLGPDHPTVAVALYRLATAQLALGDASAAVGGFGRAAAIDEVAYGHDHPEVATDLERLATAQQGVHDTAGVVASLRRALEIRLETAGPNTAGVTELRRRPKNLLAH
jgi:hypothetical protein